MKLFNERPIQTLFDGIHSTILHRLLKELNSEKIKNTDSKTFAEDLSHRNKINFKVSVNFKEGGNTVKMHPITLGAKQEVAVVTYSFPITSDSSLLQYSPNNEISLHALKNNWVDGVIDANKLIIHIPTKYANTKLTPEVIEMVTKSIMNKAEMIKKNIQNLKVECDEFDYSIYDYYFNFIEKQKENVRQKENLEDKLNPFK